MPDPKSARTVVSRARDRTSDSRRYRHAEGEPAMPRRFLVLACIASICGAGARAQSAPLSERPRLAAKAEAPRITGILDLHIVIVDDLQVKPVPLTDFRILPDAAGRAASVVRTDRSGHLRLTLPPGGYVVSTLRPIPYRDRQYSWRRHVVIRAGRTEAVELTGDDAFSVSASLFAAAPRAPALPPGVTQEGAIYARLKSGVVNVECDAGSGSGFVVDRAGLILTNQHVVNGTHWVAVRFDRGARVQATIVEEDPDADVALLRFNPSAVKTLRPVPLADLSRQPLAVEGQHVLTIGWPLHQQQVLTAGVVSRVENDILLSDIAIRHGSSGGPLLNLSGEAIGITTFLDAPSDGGPAMCGVVSIAKALPVLERARRRLADLPLPPAELLPEVPPVRIPTSAFEAAELRDLKPAPLKKLKEIEGLVYTPFVYASLQAKQDRDAVQSRRRRGAAAEEAISTPEHDWTAWADSERAPVVTFVLRPGIRETPGSRQRNALGQVGSLLSFPGPFGAVGSLISGHSRHGRTMEFRNDFYDMQLLRGGRPIEPVRRNRVKVGANQNSPTQNLPDRAFEGIYAYDPAVLEPGEPLTIRYRMSKDLNRWLTYKVDPKVQAQLWSQFAPYWPAASSRNEAKWFWSDMPCGVFREAGVPFGQCQGGSADSIPQRPAFRRLNLVLHPVPEAPEEGRVGCPRRGRFDEHHKGDIARNRAADPGEQRGCAEELFAQCPRQLAAPHPDREGPPVALPASGSFFGR
jgi:S1-C subfamily serine protease